jgi:hypothetical protein
MLHENGVPRPLVPASAIKQGVLLGRGMPDDSGHSNQNSHDFYNHFQVPSFYFKNPADATMFQLVWAKEFRQT